MKTHVKSKTKNPFIVMIILLAAAFATTSCSNDDLIPNSALDQTGEYQKSPIKDAQEDTGEASALICWKCIGEVVGADLLGAGMGFLNGAPGGPYVAGGSAILYGAVSSVGAAAIVVDNDDKNQKGNFVEKLEQYRTEPLPNPNDNPYQDIGMRHNELLQEILVTHYLTGESDLIKILSNAKLTDIERELAFSSKGNPLDWLRKLLEEILKPIGGPWLIGTHNTDYKRILSRYNTQTYQITSEFLNAVKGVESLQEYQKELDVFEAKFIRNHQDLKKEEAQQVLIELAVARYSSHFWFSTIPQ